MGARGKKRARLSIMYQKQKELAMMRDNCAKIYPIEIKIVSLTSRDRVLKNKGELKNEGDLQ